MSYTDTAEEATRALARSLLYEALVGTAPAAPPEPVRGTATTGRHVVWEKATITAALVAFGAQYGRAPTHAEWNKPGVCGIPGSATIRAVFGSVAAGLRTAGLQALPRHRPSRRRSKYYE